MRAFVVSGDFEKLLEGVTGVTHLAMSLNTLVLRFCHIVCMCFVSLKARQYVGYVQASCSLWDLSVSSSKQPR